MPTCVQAAEQQIFNPQKAINIMKKTGEGVKLLPEIPIARIEDIETETKVSNCVGRDALRDALRVIQ